MEFRIFKELLIVATVADFEKTDYERFILVLEGETKKEATSDHEPSRKPVANH